LYLLARESRQEGGKKSMRREKKDVSGRGRQTGGFPIIEIRNEKIVRTRLGGIIKGKKQRFMPNRKKLRYIERSPLSPRGNWDIASSEGVKGGVRGAAGSVVQKKTKKLKGRSKKKRLLRLERCRKVNSQTRGKKDLKERRAWILCGFWEGKVRTRSQRQRKGK